MGAIQGGYAAKLKAPIANAMNPAMNPNAAFGEAWKNLRGPQAAMGADYWRKISSYNPTDAINTYARGAASQANTYLTESLDRLRGQAVGAGRLDTGFFDSDQGELVKDSQRSLNDAIAQQAVQGAGLQLSAYGQEGSYATDQQQQYYDLLTGQLDRDTAERNAKRAEKAAKWQAAGQVLGAATKFIPFKF